MKIIDRIKHQHIIINTGLSVVELINHYGRMVQMCLENNNGISAEYYGRKVREAAQKEGEL